MSNWWIENNTPQWLDGGNQYQWLGVTELIITDSELRQVYIDLNYVYTATVSGMNIYEIDSENLIAFVPYYYGFNSVCGNDDRVFLATPGGGIKYINKMCISGNEFAPINLIDCLNNYNDFALTSANIRYLNCNNDLLVCCTDLGVDVISSGTLGHYRTNLTEYLDVYKCFISSVGKTYYTTIIDNHETIDVVYNTSNNWSTPDYRWSTNGDVLSSGININDIYVTEGTSISGYNTLFVATTSGAYVIDEYNSNYNIFLIGTDINSVWADIDSSINIGKIYVATNNSLSVFNLWDGSLIDYYSQTIVGGFGESLIASGIVDITISSI
jgi:hypothetical protein